MISMKVVKRNGSLEDVSFDKVLLRIQLAAKGLEVNPTLIAQRTLLRIYDGVKTAELDELAAQLSISLMTTNPDYGILASRIAISNHHRNTSDKFTDVVFELSKQTVEKTGEVISNISEELVELCQKHGDLINSKIDYQRDYLLDYFGFKTLEKLQYLLRNTKGKTLERPQHLMMRVSLALWGSVDLEKAFETYDMLSQKYFIHATPTNFNAGTPRQQLSSCFLQSMKSDSIVGIYDTLKDCAMISKYAGGIGLHIHDIRAKGSLIRGTNGTSNGIVPMLRNFNDTARYVDQGGGKRNGSFAIYLEPWHADVEDFLKLKLNTGSEEERCRDLFYALWVPDLFMERVEKNEPWTLFCPAEAPGLSDVYGEEFRALYTKYEQEGRGRKQVDAQKLWFKILDSQIETGTPYLLYKDACNEKSNQKNLGTIKSSNLCVAPETYILTDKGQFQIQTLAGQEVRVWNGEKWSTTTVMKTGENQRLVTVHLSNGAQITCTPYHKFLIREGYEDKRSIKDVKRVDASDLKTGMTLVKFGLQTIHSDEKGDIPFPYTHGFFCGDGTYHKNPSGYIGKGLSLYGEKKKLIPYLQIRSSSYTEDSQGKINTMLPDEIPDKFYVPMNASIMCKLNWFAGLLDSDGSVAKNGGNESLQIGSIHFEFLDRIRLMLQTLGVQSKVTLLHNERVTLLPDGKGGRKEYNCKPIYRLLVSSSGLHILTTLGLTCHRLTINGALPQRNAEQYIKVVSVIDEGRTDDTYCFNEPENHAGVFNGILTGNCTEIVEYSSPDETAVCNLASIALPSYVNTKTRTFDFKKLREAVKIVIKNLNRVIDINYYPTPETRTSNMRHRPVGLGVQGLADVFALLRVPWESDKASELNQLIFEHIYYAAVESSCEIAEKEGPYSTFEGSPMSQGVFQYDMWKVTPLTAHEGQIQWSAVSEEKDQTLPWAELKERVKKHGVRNSLLVAPMPTASTSQILGFNECITGDTLVSLTNGLAKRLDSFTNESKKINAYDEKTRNIIHDTQYEFMDKGEKDIHIITLMDGRKIKCTKDHKILTQNAGWMNAGDINKNDVLLISPIGTEDISYSDEKEWYLETNGYTFRMDSTSEREKALAFSRILGYIRTDGSIQESGKITAIFGTTHDSNTFIQDCMLIYNDTQKYKSKLTESSCIEVSISGVLASAIRSIKGMPHGRRVSQECHWPDFIQSENCPRAILREFLAGIFGGDGHSPCLIKTPNSYTFSRINISQTCCPQHKDHMIREMEKMSNLLKRLDIKTSSISYRKTKVSFGREAYQCGDTEHISIKLSLSPSIETFDTFMKNVGIRYCSHKLYRFEIAASWARYIKIILEQYNTILSSAYQITQKEQGKGRHQRSLEKAIREYEKNNCLISEYYSRPSIDLFYDYIRYSKKSNTIYKVSSLNFRNIMNAKQFLEETKTENMFNTTLKKGGITYATDKSGNLPVYQMKVIDNKMSDIQENVYDINVENTHTFIANGIVVHNCVEPITSNIYTRRTLAGEFIVINKYLMADLKKLDLWNEMMKQQIIARNGSVQGIDLIPESIQKLYKTSWEIKQKTLIDMAAARGAFICQSQSLNLFVADPNYAKLTSMHFYGWKRGLKTGLYYLRTRAPVMAQKFTIDPDLQKAAAKSEMERSLKKNMSSETEECLMCGS